jgi:hypothetical protein
MNAMIGFRFVSVEIFSFFRQKRWLLIVLIITGYLFLAESNFLFTFRTLQLSVNPWQLAVAVLEGSPFHPPLFQILGWLILPSAFVLGMGEPFSLFHLSWTQMLLSRTGTRWRYWWGRGLAWLVLGGIYVVIVIGLSLLVGFVLSPGDLRLPETLYFSGHFRSFSDVFAWVAFNFLTTIWWYTLILISCSVFVSKPGMATLVTLIAGCVFTFIGSNLEPSISFFRPLLGARLNVFPADSINPRAFIRLVLVCGLWFLVGIVDYARFRGKHL